MKKCATLAFCLAIVLGYSMSEVQARGGGHGGGHGHHSGGHHGGGHHGGHHGNHHANHHGNHNHHHNFNHHYWNHAGHRPYTAGWYGNHGAGWGYGIPYAGWWGGAGFGAASTWLGMNAASAPLAYNYPAGNNTVYTSDTGTTPAGASNANAPMTVANALAQRGAGDLAADANYLPLGVFTMAAEDEDDAEVMLHLAVTKDGKLRGSYYDLATQKEEPIQGAIDKQTQRVAFTVGSDNNEVFETSLASLTNSNGAVALHEADGQVDRWTIARLKEPPKEEKEGSADEPSKQS
jgi:hypothetical protein